VGAALSALVLGLAIGCAGDDDPASAGDGVHCDDAGSAGGVKIVLSPATPADDRTLAEAADVVCRRAEKLTDAAEVKVADGTIVARLDRVVDADHAAAALAAGTLRLRPVLAVVPAGTGPELTPPDLDVPGQQVVLAGADGQVFTLGPAVMSGDAVEAAAPTGQPVGGWAVKLVLRPGSDGIDTFNEVAAACFAAMPTCPTNQLAVAVDSQVLSAPTINEPSYRRDQLQLSGGFDQPEAEELASTLGAGRLPVELHVESVSSS
jgi:preprotein translocase subunit SecD